MRRHGDERRLKAREGFGGSSGSHMHQQRPFEPRSVGRHGFLWEINGTDGTLRITADAPLPGIFPVTVARAHGRNEPAELAVPAALAQKWPALSSLQGAPAFNVGRVYAAFAADIENGTRTVPDFADAVRRHEVITAIEWSAASGERVKV
jgi:predicted dehydrogenase